jgi:hypothetical protein
LQRQGSGEIQRLVRHTVIDRGRHDHVVAFLLEMRCRRNGVSFGGKGIHSQRQVRSVLFNYANRKDHQGFAGTSKTFNFRERNLR